MQPPGEPGERVVAGAVAPVHPPAVGQAERQPVAVPGGHLGSGDDQQPVEFDPGEMAVGRDRVVVGRRDEVQPVGAGLGRQFLGRALPVGVDGVHVQVAPVPAGAAPGDGPGQRVGKPGGPGRAPVDPHPDLPRHAGRVHHDRPERDGPRPRRDRPGQVAGCRVVGRHREPVAGAPGPPAQVGGRVEQPEVEDVLRDPGHGGERLVRGRDRDPMRAGRHLERQVRPLVEAERRAAGERRHLRAVGKRLPRDLGLERGVLQPLAELAQAPPDHRGGPRRRGGQVFDGHPTTMPGDPAAARYVHSFEIRAESFDQGHRNRPDSIPKQLRKGLTFVAGNVTLRNHTDSLTPGSTLMCVKKISVRGRGPRRDRDHRRGCRDRRRDPRGRRDLQRLRRPHLRRRPHRQHEPLLNALRTQRRPGHDVQHRPEGPAEPGRRPRPRSRPGCGSATTAGRTRTSPR